MRGGGEHSIVIKGNSIVDSITIARLDGKVRITSEDGSQVGEVTVDGSDDVILEGSFKDINILARGVITTVNNAQLTNVTLKGEGSTLVVGETTRIDNLNITSSKNTVEVSGRVSQVNTSLNQLKLNITVNKAGTIEIMTVNNEGTTINGVGTVDKVYANANNIIVTTNKTLVIASENAKGVMAGDETVESGSFKISNDETTTSTNNTSRSSKSSTSSDPVAVSAINIVTDPVDTSSLSYDAGDVTVTLTSATDGAKIYYTVNGGTPTINDALYTEPFTVSNTEGINGESITIKAIGIKSEMNNSEVTTKAIVFNRESTVTVKTTEAFEAAIESKHVNIIKLGGDITGNVTQIRTGSNNFTIDFDTYVFNGDLDITANSVKTIAFNGSENPSINGDLTVAATSATVTNAINVSGTITVNDVGKDSWYEEADGNTITLTDSNGSRIVINGNPETITVSATAAGGINITANSPVRITIESGATVNNITASGTATGTTITNNGTLSNIEADSDIGIENNNGDISVSGTGTVVTSGTASANVIGSTVVNAITDLAIDQEELRIGDITTANITTAVSGDTYNVTSAKPSIVSVDEKTGLAITANAQGKVTNQGIL